MLRMQARPAVRVRQGPLLLPARVLLLVSGLSALALGTFNLFHELHVAQVDRNYTIVALGVGIVWLASIIIAFRGQLIGVFVAGAIAFVELGVVAQSHFASTPGAIDTYAGKEGLPVATALIGLVLASVVGMFWHNNALQFHITVVGVIVFTGLTAWDAQRLKQMGAELPEGQGGAYAIVGALSLYLNFVNLFLMLLRLQGRRD